MLDGKKLLAEVAEDTFGKVLSDYYADRGITEVAERIAVAEMYYASAGLGQMKVASAGAESAEVELLHSHLDEGWIAKWDKRDKPVNFMTCGYIAGMLSAVFEKPPRAYTVTETASIVSGAERSKFAAVAS